MHDAPLPGRAAEIAILDALVADAGAGRAGVVEMCGEPGIGKTALADRAAATPGLRVLRALGVQGESGMPLAALSELLRPLRPLVAELSTARRAAVTSLLDGGSDGAADPYTLGAATLALLARAAEDGPVLVVVDDTHWVDAQSGAVLSFAFRRLGADAVAVVLCRRPGPRRPVTGPWREVALTGLGPAHTAALLDGAAPAVATQIQHLTGGNPLAVRELRRTLTAGQLAGDVPLPDPLPLGEDGTAAFADRVTGLAAATRLALTVLAAAGPGGTGLLAAALAGVRASATDLDPAERDGLVVVVDGRPGFAHPLMRAAVFAAADPARRRAAHAALAQACGGHDPQQRAHHLAAASALPSEEVAGALEEAAADAERRGGPAAGVEARLAAARRSPDAGRDERRLRAAESCALAGRQDEAADLAAAVIGGTAAGPVRHRALALVATLSIWRVGALAAVPGLLGAFDELAGSATDTAALMALQCATALVSMGHLTPARQLMQRARRLTITDPVVRFLVEHRHAGIEAWSGDLATYAEIERRFPLRDHAEAARRRYPVHDVLSGQQLMLVERFAEARAVVDADLAAARGSAAPRLLVLPLMQRADLDLLTRDAVRPTADLDEVLELLDQGTGLGQLAGYAHSMRARAAAWAGDEQAARRHAQAALVGLLRDELGPVRWYRGHALGVLELGLGRPAEAVEALRVCARISASVGLDNPVGVAWRADHVEALHAAGRAHEARAALAAFEDLAARTGSRWARAAAARCRALLGDPDWPDLCAAALDEQHDLPFDRGRTLLLQGELLRRTRQLGPARVALTDAAELLGRIGARPWAARARAELRATGVASPEPSRTGPGLTGQELRVCLAVAEGATNKEAAAALFLSPKTVEYHLGRAFTKLGVSNRAQLARLVAEGGLARLSL